MQLLDNVCGLKVLNAAIGGTKIEDWPKLSENIIEITRPKLVILAIGTNNAALNVKKSIGEFNYYMSYLIDRNDTRFIIVSPPNLDVNYPGAQAFDTVYLKQIQTYIRSLSDKNVAIVPPSGGKDQTVDGVHLNLKGQQMWAAKLQSACAY